MKIKKWTGSAWQTLSPQVTYTDIVDDVTAVSPDPIFDSGKLKASYLPDFIFGGMRFLDTLPSSGFGYSLIADKLHSAYLAYGQDDLDGLIGKYLVSEATLFFQVPTSTDKQQKGDGSSSNPTKYYLWQSQQANNSGVELEEDDDGGQDFTIESGDWLVITGVTGAGTSGDPYVFSFSVVNNTYQYAGSNVGGIIKLGFSQSGTNYPVQINTDKKAYVSVPWTDTNTRRSVSLAGTEKLTASSTTALNFATAGGNITISESNGTFTFNSTDTNTTYGTANTATSGLVRLGVAPASATVNSASTTAGRYYPVGASTSGNLYVNVPWEDTNTNTQLSNEQVQDIVGGMLTGNTETSINVVYQDSDGTIDFSVDDGVGLTGTSNGLKMTYPIAIDNSGTGPDANSGYRITNGALWFDLS